MKTKFARFIQIFIVLVFLLGSVNLTTVFAQDEEPTEPVAAEGIVVEATEVITEAPIVVEETAVPTEAPVVEKETAVSTEAPAAEEEKIAEVVKALAEEEVVLMNENGQPIAMGSAEAAEVIANADPWFIDPSDSTQVIAYQVDCTGWVPPAPYTGGVCNVSSTPIQSAIDAAPEGATVNLVGTFNETVIITKSIILDGGGVTTIAPLTIPSTNGTETTVGVIYIDGSGSDTVVHVVLKDLLIDGINLDGSYDPGITTIAGVYVNDAEMEIINTAIKNFLSENGLTGVDVVFEDNSALVKLFPLASMATKTKNITICHATSSATNPYNLITVDESSIVVKKHGKCVLTGHGLDKDDIIPAFTGDECSFAGQGDQTILANGCVVPAPAIDVVKSITSSGPYVEGSTITYSIVVTNTGNVDLTDVTVTDPNAVISGTCSATTLAKEGGSFTCTASHMVNATDIASGLTYVNTATAKGTYAGVEYSDDGEVTAELDIYGCMDETALNYDESATIDDKTCVYAAPAITVVKSITSSGPYVEGSTITYSIVVTNTGNVDLTNVTVTDPNAVISGTCSEATLAKAGGSFTCSASHVVSATDIEAGLTYVNTATAKGTYAGGDYSDDGDVTANLDIYGCMDETAINYNEDATLADDSCIAPAPAITAVKSITSTGPYLLGSTISYNIVVTNTGNVTLHNVSISDPAAILGVCPITIELAVGATKTCTATHVVVAADVTSGSFTNTGIGDSDETAPVSSSVSSIITAPTIIPPVIPVTGGTPPALLIPVTGGQLIPVTGGTLIVSGIGHSCMTYNNGQVICWGLNASGQVGDGTLLDQHKPVYVKDLEGVLNLTAGSKHTCALMIDGEIWCWGENSSGQLGNNTVVNSNVPVKVEGLPDKVLAITAGEEFTCAQMMNQDVWCWGKNNLGQLNDGTTTNQLKPVKSKLNTMLAQISGGQGLLLGSDFFGSVNEWAKVQAAAVQQLAGSLSISANRWGDTGCAVASDGSVKCWDSNLISAAIKDTLPAMEVGAGMEHSCVVNNDQTVSCWGANLSGQLGNGSNTDSLSATLVKNMSKVRALGVGANHTCVLSGTNNTPMCWGENTFGQLGNDSTTNSNLPVYVILPAIQ